MAVSCWRDASATTINELADLNPGREAKRLLKAERRCRPLRVTTHTVTTQRLLHETFYQVIEHLINASNTSFTQLITYICNIYKTPRI